MYRCGIETLLAAALITDIAGINCTVVELKLIKEDILLSLVNVLIVPLWN